MGLFDTIGKGLGQMGGGEGQNKLIGAAAQWINSSNVGGLSGLLQMFEQHGQGDKVRSWVSQGENQEISPDEVESALGHERVQQFANEAGVSEQEASSGLSALLPKLVDMLTPDGKVPQGNESNNALSQLASRFLKH